MSRGFEICDPKLPPPPPQRTPIDPLGDVRQRVAALEAEMRRVQDRLRRIEQSLGRIERAASGARTGRVSV